MSSNEGDDALSLSHSEDRPVSNQPTARMILQPYADKVSGTDTSVVCEIVGPLPSDLGERFDHLACYLTKVATRDTVAFLAIDYFPEGNFGGGMRLQQDTTKDFASVSEYQNLLDDAFNDPRIVELIGAMRRAS